jgi:hypothetical protein
MRQHRALTPPPSHYGNFEFTSIPQKILCDKDLEKWHTNLEYQTAIAKKFLVTLSMFVFTNSYMSLSTCDNTVV